MLQLAFAALTSLFDCILRSTAIPSPPCPVLSDDESDTSLGLPKIFLNNASDSDSSITPSNFDDSNESRLNSDDESNSESKDELALEDEEEQVLLEFYLKKAKALNIS